MRMATAILLCAATIGCAEEWNVIVVTADGNRVSGDMDLSPLELETSLGKVTLTIDQVTMINFEPETVSVSTRDGNCFKGKCSVTTWKVKSTVGEFALDPKSIAAISIVSRAGGVPPSPSVQPGSSPPRPGPTPTSTPEPKVDLPVLGRIDVKGSMGGLSLSQERKRVYALNASDGKLLVIDAASFETKKAIELSGEETRMSMSANGKTIVATGKKRVSVIDLASESVSRSFQIEFEIQDAYSTDGEAVYASTNREFVVISVSRQGVTDKVDRSYGGGMLVARPDGRKLYSGSGAYVLPEGGQGKVIYQALNISSSGSAGIGSITWDGRFLVGAAGPVFRLGRSPKADLVEFAKVEAHGAAVSLPEGKAVLLFTNQGMVKRYGVPSFVMEKSWSLGLGVQFAGVDEPARALYLFAGTASRDPYGAGYPGRSAPIGDLYKIAVPE